MFVIGAIIAYAAANYCHKHLPFVWSDPFHLDVLLLNSILKIIFQTLHIKQACSLQTNNVTTTYMTCLSQVLALRFAYG